MRYNINNSLNEVATMNRIPAEQLKMIGNRIREARTAKGMSQLQLADAIQVSPIHISNIEMGKKDFSISILIKIAETLQVSTDCILRADTPEIQRIYAAELEELLRDCSPSEKNAILDMARIMKNALNEAREHGDD